MAFNFNNLNLSNVQFSSGSSVIPVGDHVVSVTGAELTRTKTGASQVMVTVENNDGQTCLLYTSPSPRDGLLSRMPSSA